MVQNGRRCDLTRPSRAVPHLERKPEAQRRQHAAIHALRAALRLDRAAELAVQAGAEAARAGHHEGIGVHRRAQPANRLGTLACETRRVSHGGHGQGEVAQRNGERGNAAAVGAVGHAVGIESRELAQDAAYPLLHRMVVADRALQREPVDRPLILREERRHRRAPVVEIRVRIFGDRVRNAAIRELLPLVRRGVGRVGIVDIDLPALGIHQTAKISVDHRQGRHRQARSRIGRVACALPGEKPEGAVAAVIHFGNEYRTARGCAEFVAIREGRFDVTVLALPGHAVSAIAIVLKERSVELIGAAAHRHDDRARSGVARRRAVHFHLQLLESIQIRSARHVPSFIGLVDGRAIENDHVRPARQAVGLHPAAHAVAVRGPRDTRNRLEQVLIAAPQAR